jgi:pilus assembly protein CpaB
MNQRFLSVFAFAVLVAAIASFVLYRATAARPPAQPAELANPVVVAARDLQAGTLVKDTDLKVESRSGALPAGASRKKRDFIGRGVIAAVYRSEIVVDSRLAPTGAGAGMAAMIRPGMRAVAVRVNDVVGLAGFVLPGMRVDVLIAAGPVVKTLLQNIEVLSAGQHIQKDAEGKPVSAQVVNLLVTPDQAELLSLAANQASIQLVLRNPLDSQVAQTSGALMSRVLGTAPPERPGAHGVPVSAKPPAAPAPARAPEPKPVVVEMFHGVKRAEARFIQEAQP